MYAEGPDFAQTKNFVIIEDQTATKNGWIIFKPWQQQNLHERSVETIS